MVLPSANLSLAAVTPGVTEAATFVDKVNHILLFPLIALMTAVALLYFIYGGFKYIYQADDPHAREEGQQGMMYGIIGMFIMLVAYTILSIAAGTIGVQDELDCANDPQSQSCAQSSFNSSPLLKP
jgi:Type IV secretion system pilin